MMKNLRLFLVLSFFPLFGFAQSLNGVYIGVLSNDTTTIRKDQSFEMALTEYKGKVFGYAYSTFIINDTLYYIVKRVKGKIEGDICEVEDDEVISHNFPQKPEKKVFVTYTLRRNTSDSTWRLDGNWKTNLTKKYYAISGKVETKEEKDLSKSKLYEHLGDLDLQKTLAFNKPKEEIKPVKAKEDKNDVAKNTVKKEEKKNDVQNTESKPVDKKPDAIPKKGAIATNANATEKRPEVSVAKTESKLPDNKTVSGPANIQQVQNEKKDVAITNTNPIEKKPDNNIVKTDNKLPDNKSVSPNTTTAKPETKQPDNKLVSVPVGYQPNQNAKKDIPVITTTTITDKKAETSVAKIPDNKPPEKKDVASTEKKPNNNFEFQELTRTNRNLKPASSLVDGRVSIPSETIYFKSDSLSIALYDNGEVDGDTVSVIINDVMFIEKQGLKSSAFRKTFYVPKDESDSLLVVLFANNLGKYPPNTGLLQIKDGEEIFYVRFKADLDRNAAIVLRRKPK
jgi:hypothetical protein